MNGNELKRRPENQIVSKWEKQQQQQQNNFGGRRLPRGVGGGGKALAERQPAQKVRQ